MATGNGQPRTYTISTETENGLVNSTMLTNEINAEAGITTSLSHINTAAGSMDIFFASDLSGGEITTLDALVLDHDGYVTSPSFQFWESNPAKTTTQETYQESFSRTAAAMADGTYRLSWYFELRVTPNGGLNSNAQARFLVDGNVKGNANVETLQWHAFSGWDRYNATEGERPVLSLEYRRDPVEGGDDTIEIRKMKLGIELMG